MNETTTIPAFIAKLWEMVNDSRYDNLIQWCSDGTSFVINDQLTFCTALLPVYYKHNNMASFIRQLNKYGFRKVVSLESSSLKNDRTDLEFSHPYFLRGCPELLPEIKRKASLHGKDVPYNAVIGQLAKEVLQLQKNQSVFESKLCTMKNENTALWREHSILRQKHQNLQKVLNKLIQFILTLVQQTRGVNLKRINMPLMIKDKKFSGENLAAIKDHYTNLKSRNGDPTYGSSQEEIIIPDILDQSGSSSIQVDFPVSSSISVIESDSSSDSNVAVPLHEVSPAIVYGKPVVPNKEDGQKQMNPTSGILESNKRKRKAEGNIDVKQAKSILKRGDSSSSSIHLNSATFNAPVRKNDKKTFTTKNLSSSCETTFLNKSLTTPAKEASSLPHSKSIKTLTPNGSRTSPLNKNVKKDSGTPKPVSNSIPKAQPKENILQSLLINSNTDDNSNIDNIKIYQVQPGEDIAHIEDISSIPIILSPSGTEIQQVKRAEKDQSTPDQDTVASGKEENLSEGSTNHLISSLEPLQNDIDNRIEAIQSDLNILKDLMQNEGISIDASTLLNLLNEDPLTLNMPEAAGLPSDMVPSNSELMAYQSPSLLDIVESLDDGIDDSENPEYITPVPTPTLNTPKPDYFGDIFSPMPAKKK